MENEKSVGQLLWSFISSKYLWITLFSIFTLMNLGFYSYYLYLVYTNDREAVRPYYDDEKKELRSNYSHIWVGILIAWLIIFFCFMLSLFEIRHAEVFQGVGIVFCIVVFSIAWIMNQLASMISRKTYKPVIKEIDR